MRFKNTNEQNKSTKKMKFDTTKNLLKREIEHIRLVEGALIMGFVMWGLIMVITAKDVNDYGILPILVAAVCAGIPYVCLRLLPIKTHLSMPKTYQGSLEELVTELEEINYSLKEKIGDMYIFSTRYCFVTQFRFYAQDKGASCKVFGSFPSNLMKLEEKTNTNKPYNEEQNGI